jgi:hypothetical protein
LIYLGFITEGKLAAVLIKPSLGVSNWPVIYIINYTPTSFLALFNTAPSAPHAIWSPRFQPHLGGNVERLVGVVWSSRILSGCGDLRNVKELIGSSSFFFVSGTDMVFMTRSTTSRSTTSRPQPTTLGRLRKERQRRCAVDTVWRLKMKGFSRISL